MAAAVRVGPASQARESPGGPEAAERAVRGGRRGRYDDLQERLTRLARRHYRSLNGEILAALEAWLEQSRPRKSQPMTERWRGDAVARWLAATGGLLERCGGARSTGVRGRPGRLGHVGAFAEGLVAQVRQALENVVAVLRAGGAEPRHLVRLTWYVLDREAYRSSRAEIGRVYREVIGSSYPAMTLVQVAGLLEDRALVEIEATAVIAGR